VLGLGAVCTPVLAQDPALGPHYLLYDVRAGEGFNLRRDTLLRAALTTQLLGPGWTLVLPPFGALPHWRDREATVEGLPWRTFFDVDALAHVVPVIEFDEYVERQGPRVDRLLQLDPIPMPDPLPPEPIVEPRPCNTVDAFDWHRLEGADSESVWRGAVFSSRIELQAGQAECLGVFGPYPAIVPRLLETPGAVLVEPFEHLYWDGRYSGPQYWAIRRQLVFAERLRVEAQRFRHAAFGGQPYLAVHLRRGDFVQAHTVPSLPEVARQLRDLQRQTGLARVFVASDASDAELAELRPEIDFVVYRPDPEAGWLDGEVAIIDQILATGGAWFIGTSPSTFSTVIMEERELAGRLPETTWNVLCAPASGRSGEAQGGCMVPRRPVAAPIHRLGR
jgi:hypothetical protein